MFSSLPVEFQQDRKILFHNYLSEAQLINWRIAIKPGRPFICAKLGAKYVFGLPGNPVAAFICALIILRPSLGRLGGEKDWFKPFSFKANANFKKYKRAGRTEFLRANLNREDGVVSIFHLRDLVDSPVYRGQTV